MIVKDRLPFLLYYVRCWVQDKIEDCGEGNAVECTRDELDEVLPPLREVEAATPDPDCLIRAKDALDELLCVSGPLPTLTKLVGDGAQRKLVRAAEAMTSMIEARDNYARG